MTGRGLPLAGALLTAVLSGCMPASAPPEAPAGPVIVLTPPAPGTRAPPGAASAAVVARDTAALRSLATRYVVRRDANPAVIDRLSTLTLQARRAVERMQASRTRAGYRQADVVAARVAADTLGAFLQTQPATAPAAVSFAPPSPASSSNEAHP